MTTLQDVIAYIGNEATTGDLDLIFKSGNARNKTLRSLGSAEALATLKPGDVCVTTGLKPKYLSDLEVTIVKRSPRRSSDFLVRWNDEFDAYKAIERYGRETSLPAGSLILKGE